MRLHFAGLEEGGIYRARAILSLLVVHIYFMTGAISN